MSATRPGLSRWPRLEGLALLTVLAILAGCISNPTLRQDAWVLMQSGQYDAAEAKLRVALQQNPGDWRANFLLAKIRLIQNKPLEAQLLLEHALTQNPAGEETPAILDNLAESLYQQGQKERLASFLKDTASSRFGVADYLRQAKYLGKIGDTDGANIALRKAARMARSDDKAAYVAMADYYDSVGDQERAVTALRQAYYIDPRDVRINERLRAKGLVPGPTIALPPAGGPPY